MTFSYPRFLLHNSRRDIKETAKHTMTNPIQLTFGNDPLSANAVAQSSFNEMKDRKYSIARNNI